LNRRGINFIDAWNLQEVLVVLRNSACAMIGGNYTNFLHTEELFKQISFPCGYKFFEGAGAGHFVKMVHNGIEYGMMQAIAEGFEVLRKSNFNLNLKDVSEIYNKGSVIQSRLIGWLLKAFDQDGVTLENISGEVDSNGEGKWTVEAAKEIDILVKVIEDALQFRIDSKVILAILDKLFLHLETSLVGMM
ncbi:MAG: hypothetical protein Q9M91_06415, partial [Candidatus Dojkabacteria bacterium]|nr:hypothetical protein [Candidatus Dojkabacteria bacterium]